MHRLFVAIRPPAAVRRLLTGLMGGVPGARWQDDDQLHLTLRFIGEVDRPVAEDITAMLARIHHPPFELAIHGLGLFDRRGHPEMLWAGVAPHDPLTTLHHKVDQALVCVGLAPETRAYLPHITLARFGRAAGGIDGFATQHGGLASAPFAVTHFGLFESHLGHEGARYELVERYALTA